MQHGIDQLAFPGQFEFGLPSLLALGRFADGAADGRNEPVQTIFEHVIGGAALDGFNGRFFANTAGYENEGKSGSPLLGQFQCVFSIEGGKRIVAQDEIETVLSQSLFVFGSRADADHLTGDSLLLEKGAHQFGIARIIFQMQNSQRCLFGVFHFPSTRRSSLLSAHGRAT